MIHTHYKMNVNTLLLNTIQRFIFLSRHGVERYDTRKYAHSPHLQANDDRAAGADHGLHNSRLLVH